MDTLEITALIPTKININFKDLYITVINELSPEDIAKEICANYTLNDFVFDYLEENFDVILQRVLNNSTLDLDDENADLIMTKFEEFLNALSNK